jgi:transposase
VQGYGRCQDIVQHKHDRYESRKQSQQIADRNIGLVREQNHVISNKILDVAAKAKSIIKMKKSTGNLLQEMIEQKAKLQGINVEYMDSFLSTKTCHKCGSIGIVEKTSTNESKQFVCPN